MAAYDVNGIETVAGDNDGQGGEHGVRVGLRVTVWLYNRVNDSAHRYNATLNAYVSARLAYAEAEYPPELSRQFIDMFFMGRKGKELIAFLAHQKAIYRDTPERDYNPKLASKLRACESTVLAARVRGPEGEKAMPEAMAFLQDEECVKELDNQRQWNDGLHDGRPHGYRERHNYLARISTASDD